MEVDKHYIWLIFRRKKMGATGAHFISKVKA